MARVVDKLRGADPDLADLESKTQKNELRARDAEARLKIIQSEVGILQQRKVLEQLKSETPE
jgi:hypothetical protein